MKDIQGSMDVPHSVCIAVMHMLNDTLAHVPVGKAFFTPPLQVCHAKLTTAGAAGELVYA